MGFYGYLTNLYQPWAPLCPIDFHLGVSKTSRARQDWTSIRRNPTCERNGWLKLAKLKGKITGKPENTIFYGKIDGLWFRFSRLIHWIYICRDGDLVAEHVEVYFTKISGFLVDISEVHGIYKPPSEPKVYKFAVLWWKDRLFAKSSSFLENCLKHPP